MTDNKKPVYVGSWHPWYKCSKCPHVYGYKDPLDTHWDKCCPACGSFSETYVPPNIKGSRRFICTYKPSWFERTFLSKEDVGHYEYIWPENENWTVDYSGTIAPASISLGITGLSATTIAAVSAIL